MDSFASQHEIEKYVKEFFPNPGIFLEIGCWDGELISQTAFLERELGWKGLCVDPFPRNFENRTCQLSPKAVSADGKVREFVKVTIDRRYGGDVSYFSGFVDHIQTHWPLIEEHCEYKIIHIETMTFDQLISWYAMPHYIDFLSIDTEGSEWEIIQSINFDKYEFGMIDYEHNENQEVRELVKSHLAARGYDLYKALRVDDIFISRKLK